MLNGEALTSFVPCSKTYLFVPCSKTYFNIYTISNYIFNIYFVHIGQENPSVGSVWRFICNLHYLLILQGDPSAGNV